MPIASLKTLCRRTKLLALFLSLLALLTVGLSRSIAGTNDYPSQWMNSAQDAVVDNWGFYNRECTSFAAWRLHSRNGFDIPRAYGYANVWGTRAAGEGYTVNMTPALGAIAWWSNGHVAWVEAVNGSNVTIEEYNYDYAGHYHERIISANSVSDYIHFKDIPIAPPAVQPGVSSPESLYRYSGPFHFYTTNFGELGNGNYGYGLEGIQCHVFSLQGYNMTPLYRYGSRINLGHFYTTNWSELGNGNSDWTFEKIQCYVYTSPFCSIWGNTVPLYRYVNLVSGDRFYTTGYNELGGGNWMWRYESIQCWVLP